MSKKNKKDTETLPADFIVKIMDLAKWKSLANKSFGPNGARYSFEHEGGFLSIEFYSSNKFDKVSQIYKRIPQVTIVVGKGNVDTDPGRIVFRGNVWDVPVSAELPAQDVVPREEDENEDEDDDDARDDIPEVELEIAPGAFRPINAPRRIEVLAANVFNNMPELRGVTENEVATVGADAHTHGIALGNAAVAGVRNQQRVTETRTPAEWRDIDAPAQPGLTTDDTAEF